jgi:hypothetical protein
MFQYIAACGIERPPPRWPAAAFESSANEAAAARTRFYRRLWPIK